MAISKFKESDKEDVLKIHSEVYKPYKLPRFLWSPCQQIESLEQDCPKLIWKDEKIKGYAAAYLLDKTHFRLNLLVLPEYQNQNTGTSLLQKIKVEIKKQGAKYLQARVLEYLPDSLIFAEKRNFTRIHRMSGMSLKAKDFNFEKFRDLGEKLSGKGFSITTFQEESNNNPIEKLAELHKRAEKDWESPDPTWKIKSPKKFFRSLFENIAFPKKFSIVKYGEEYVGYTSSERENKSATAVHPAFRNLGVATFMKAVNLEICIDAGENYFETCSASASMQKVNEKLGYKFNNLTEVRFVKYL